MENKRIDADELIRLKKLVDDDIISQEEFELQKKKMLGEVPSTKETERIKETSLVEKAKELTKKLEKNKPVSTLKKQIKKNQNQILDYIFLFLYSLYL